MDIIRSLITKAKKAQALPSDAALARLLKVTPARLSQWKTGLRPCPIPRLVVLAELAGVDVERALGRYTMEKLKE